MQPPAYADETGGPKTAAPMPEQSPPVQYFQQGQPVPWSQPVMMMQPAPVAVSVPAPVIEQERARGDSVQKRRGCCNAYRAWWWFYLGSAVLVLGIALTATGGRWMTVCYQALTGDDAGTLVRYPASGSCGGCHQTCLSKMDFETTDDGNVQMSVVISASLVSAAANCSCADFEMYNEEDSRLFQLRDGPSQYPNLDLVVNDTDRYEWTLQLRVMQGTTIVCQVGEYNVTRGAFGGLISPRMDAQLQECSSGGVAPLVIGIICLTFGLLFILISTCCCCYIRSNKTPHAALR